ncbi:50S ribosomal protein L5 [archaeon]|nr:50S ribosomal protein L5 [archaeon]MBT3450715.1 50S ribosomal protein L5 [archaeon]MBT6869207.1 50S ribosomal protein L5 [archaeon]MBT7193743.1 50S ribosomal protein L5 [archaeon]MBT7381390.1 50S ribosomal protein L5 [archaeon]
MNLMKEIKISKITLNIGAGKNEVMLNKGLKLLSKLTPVKPVKTTSNKRIPAWGLRPGLQIGAKVTIRAGATELLKKLLVAKENQLSKKSFDTNGNFSFGVAEYIDIEGLEYDPELKIMGLEVAVTLERPGFRIKKRRILTKKIGKDHLINKEEAMNFVTKKFGVTVI